jgi:hypothetical protein
MQYGWVRVGALPYLGLTVCVIVRNGWKTFSFSCKNCFGSNFKISTIGLIAHSQDFRSYLHVNIMGGGN